MLEAERAARERTERLQRTMTALVASASLADVTTAVFQYGLPAFGASAAQLALVDQQQPELLVTLTVVGFPESAVTGWDELPVSAPSPAQEAAATSATVYLPTPEDLAAKYPDAYNALIRSSHRAWVALPLRSSGRVLGVLTLAFPGPHPIDDGADQISLTALGSAVADALSRAIQHDTDRDLVMSVQRSLLPETLPEHPAVRLSGRYLPAETQYGIGGDWYDAVLLPGGGSCSWWAMSPVTGSRPRSPWARCGPPPACSPRPTGLRTCSMLWISSWTAGRTYGQRPPPSPSSTPRGERSGIASRGTRPCCCATPTGPSPCLTRREDRYWALGRATVQSRWSATSRAASSCSSPTGSSSGAAR